MIYAPLQLTGKTAVVIWGTSGIGRAIAHALAEAGADTVVSARRIDQIEQAASEIESQSRRTLRVIRSLFIALIMATAMLCSSALHPCVVAAPVASQSAARATTGGEMFYESREAMGTTFDIYLYAADRQQAVQLFDDAFDEIERIEAFMSNYRSSSELSRINARAAHEAVVTDPETFAFIEKSLDWSRRTDGAFDITVGRLMRAWGFFRGDGRLPTDAELTDVRARTGWQHVQLDAAKRAVRFRASVELDPGGIGKGYAVDAVVDLLRANDIRAALVVAGSSSIYALGAPPGKTGWSVQIPEPIDRRKTIEHVSLRDASLTTSGSYEKFFRINGRTYCHIMDPRTGRPVEGMLQTTIIAPSATDGEALSKATFVAGAIEGARLLGSLPHGFAGLFVTDRAGTSRVVRVRLGTSPQPGEVSRRFTEQSPRRKAA